MAKKQIKINYSKIALLMAADPLEVSQIQDESSLEIVSNHEFDLREVEKVLFPVLVFGVVMFVPMPSYARFAFLKGSRNEVTMQTSQPEAIQEVEKDTWLKYFYSWISPKSWKEFLRNPLKWKRKSLIIKDIISAILLLLFLLRFAVDSHQRDQLIARIENLTGQLLKCREGRAILKQLNDMLANKPPSLVDKEQFLKEIDGIGQPRPFHEILEEMVPAKIPKELMQEPPGNITIFPRTEEEIFW